jgi:hypothetical protein
MDIGKAFTYVFEDAKWLTKLLFAALFALLSTIIIGVPFLLGYQVELIRNVHRGDPQPLPEWSNLGAKFSEGLKLLVVVFVYALPLIVLACCANIIVAAGSGGSGSSDSGGAIAAIASIVGLLFTCVQLIYAIIFAIILPAVILRFTQTGDIAASFRFGEVIAIPRRAPGPYVITILISIVAQFVGQLGLIACVIGVFFTIAYAYFVIAHLYGQLWGQIDQAPASSF